MHPTPPNPSQKYGAGLFGLSLPSAHERLLTLRQRAETRRHLVTQTTDMNMPVEVQRLLEELQVHQIELEMQYEELVTAQAEAEQAHEQYIDLYDFAPVGYFTLTATGLIQQLNLCASQQLGTVRQRLAGRRFALFVAASHRGDFGQFMARVFSTEKNLSCELPLLREDGTTFYAHLEALRIDQPPSLPATERCCRLAVLDIDARYQATASLAASEARFRKLFSESSDAVVLMQGHRYVDCNMAALRLLGAYRREQLVGQSLWHFCPEHQPDGRSTISLFHESIEKALHLGTCRCEAQMNKVTGEKIWIEAVLTPIDLDQNASTVHVLWRDVTAERHAAQQLRESEARLKLALDASQTGIFTWDFATNHVLADELAQAAFGRPASGAHLPVQELGRQLHPDDAARIWGGLQAAIAVQQPLSLAFRVQWADGSVHHISAAGCAVADARGHSTRFAGVLRDTTAVTAAEEELKYKSLVLERLLGNMPMMLARVHANGEYLESMGNGLRALGLPEHALVGRNVLREFPSLAAPMRRVLAGEPLEFMAELEIAGQPVSFLNYGFFDEERQQAVVLSVDVTEVEQGRRQLRVEKEFTQSILENSIDGIITLDQSGRITTWNSQATRYFGPRAEAAVGQPLLAVLPNLGTDETHQVLSRVLSGEQVLLLGLHHCGSRYDAYHVPLRQEGEITGVLLIFRDVTDRDRLAEEATQLRLRRQQEVLAAILSTQESERKRIAEALHNGLGQLLYATKLCLESKSSTTTTTHKALALLREAIGTTRTISFELTPGVLEDFGLRIALEELVKRITPAGLPVSLHFAGLEGRLPSPVEIAVYRMVQELLNNVMKHAHATDVVVHVAREQHRLEVTVEDNGCGFDVAVLATQPLAGIGLAGVRNRVSLLGGTFSLNSQPGRGTIVSLELGV